VADAVASVARPPVVRFDRTGEPGQPVELGVSVVIPVFNERSTLGAEFERVRAALASLPYESEIIFVDDGSTDGSAEELDRLSRVDGVRVIHFSRNRGTGSARKAGTKAARGQVVIWTDADLTLPNDEIPRLLRELDGFDQVVGARTSEEGSVRALRTPVKWAIRRLASYLMMTSIPDLNSGFRAFRRDVALQFVELLPKGFSCTTTMTMTFLANGYSVNHIPIRYVPRTAGKSHFHWRKDTLLYLNQVIRLVLSYEPLRVFLPLGLVLASVATVKLAYDWSTKDFHLATNTLLVFFAAFQTFTIGFVADLIVRFDHRRCDVDPASL
jgi:polyisoprenyl-phosphate glycosyltransferase